MPRGTPYGTKCPKCRRGKYGHGPKVRGVRETKFIERRVTRSAHSGHGSGGPSFHGHRGEVECLDCGHRWFSTLASTRVRCWEKVCPHGDDFAKERTP